MKIIRTSRKRTRIVARIGLLAFALLIAIQLFKAFVPSPEQPTFPVAFSPLQLETLDLDAPTFELTYQGKHVTAATTIHHPLQEYIKGQLQRFKPDHAAVVVIDNKTGKILAGVGYSKETNSFDYDLIFSNTHPSASLFKIVTAADLLENTLMAGDSHFNFYGRSSTLYKNQLKDSPRPGSRKISLNDAFARSNNPVFGKAAIKYSNDDRLVEMAERFGFNGQLMNDISLKSSVFRAPTSEYNRAELASGFNRETNISPIHAAILAQIIANEGMMVGPRIIEQFSDEKLNESLFSLSSTKDVISRESALELKNMMKLTIKKGTASKSFRGFSRGKYKNIEVGGKTGSITGGDPFGKRDWFAGFSYRKHDAQNGISISVMMVNKKKWIIRSSAMARRIFERYYSHFDQSIAFNP